MDDGFLALGLLLASAQLALPALGRELTARREDAARRAADGRGGWADE